MTSIEADAEDYLSWMCVHNYAKTTILGRRYYRLYATNWGERPRIVVAG